MTILVTGAAGFIGSNFVDHWFSMTDENLVSFDLITYAGNLKYLQKFDQDPRHTFVQGDISDQALVVKLLQQYKPRAIIHFAAETHVDRSISSPEKFLSTNVMGTFHLLEAAKIYLGGNKRASDDFRFIHISTDEVYGDLAVNAPAFDELSVYAPNNPYAASKASSDHLVRSYFKTYGLPVITMHCSNNYGPHQYPEKLIPLCIFKGLAGEPLPIYGDGLQIRDWIYVKDTCAAVSTILERGVLGEVYNVGARNEKTNLELIQNLCALMDKLKPREGGLSYKSQITHVEDRLGHDIRYAINPTKMEQTLGWHSAYNFESGLRETVEWYLSNRTLI